MGDVCTEAGTELSGWREGSQTGFLDDFSAPRRMILSVPNPAGLSCRHSSPRGSQCLCPAGRDTGCEVALPRSFQLCGPSPSPSQAAPILSMRSRNRRHPELTPPLPTRARPRSCSLSFALVSQYRFAWFPSGRRAG